MIQFVLIPYRDSESLPKATKLLPKGAQIIESYAANGGWAFYVRYADKA